MEVRIITKRLPDGRTEIWVYDPVHGREVRTGMKSRDRQDLENIRESLERKGLRVTHKEI